MKTPASRVLFLLAVILTLALPGASRAQDAPPAPEHYSQTYGSTPYRDSRPPDPFRVPDDDMTECPPRSIKAAALNGEKSVALGQPGTSFRYVKTFGETDIAYLSDTAHLNYPYGIGTDGNNVWIAELWGQRALKYASDGTFVASIGKGGTHGPFWEANDIAVDGSGHIWVAHSGGVTEFDGEGNEVRNLWRDDDPNTHFANPQSIAFDSAGNIYVSDGAPWWSNDDGHHRIQVFKPDGSYLQTIGTSDVAGASNYQFHGPRHIAIYNNVLYVADSGNHRVQIFDLSMGPPIRIGTIGVTGERGSDNGRLSNPSGVAIDSNFIYVTDRWNHRVQVFSRSALTYVATIGQYGDGNSQFHEPTDVAVDASGNIYVADFVNTRAQQFGPGRNYIRTLGMTETPYVTDAAHYNRPTGVAVAPDGSVYITEEMGHRLVKLSASGDPLWTVGKAGVKGDWNDDNDRLNNPSDVTLDSAGRVYVADRWHGRIQIYNPDSSYFASIHLDGCPNGVTVAPNSNIYVSDPCSQRVLIYGANFQLQTTLGVNGQAGNDNAHFDNPEDVAVDSRGRIYVSDRGNHRVQVYDANRAYLRTLGTTGECGGDFAHFCSPNNLTVDAANRLYVADSGNTRVQVFDADGAYLTTVGGSYGTRTGQMQSADGVAIGPDGSLYVSEWGGMRIQKYALGTPGWKQVNINGFGDRDGYVQSLTVFKGDLYAGGSGSGGPAVWRLSGDQWSSTERMFGNSDDGAVESLAAFGDQLYATTYNWQCDDPECNSGHSEGVRIWRSGDAVTWTNVVTGGLGSKANQFVINMTTFQSQLYAATINFETGGEIWRTANGTSWNRVAEGNFGSGQTNWWSLEEFKGQLYAGLYGDSGGQLHRYNGTTWTAITTNGFGEPGNTSVNGLATFSGALYAQTRNSSGTQIWRSETGNPGTWSRVMEGGFGNPANRRGYGLIVAGSHLYSVQTNLGTGDEVWRTADGTNWTQVGFGGWGDSNNTFSDYSDIGAAVLNGRLYIATGNSANGAEIWATALTADFTATPTRGRPPLTVQFTNTSAGDYTTSAWDFGDGATSTETNPTHTYAQAGTYTVKLTVGDGTDSDTVTRAAAVRVGYTLYLPTVTRNWDPLMYENFDDPTWDGAWNPAKWMPDQTATVYRQQGGALVVTEPPSANPPGGTLRAVSPQFRSWQKTQRIEARLKVSSDRTGDWSPIGIALVDEDVNGHVWFAACRLGASANSSQASFGCSVFISQGNNYPSEYETSGFPVDYNTWCTARLETDPVTGNVKFYLNNALIGSRTPSDAVALVASDRMAFMLTNWGVNPNSAATRYVDDVRITPAK